MITGTLLESRRPGNRPGRPLPRATEPGNAWIVREALSISAARSESPRRVVVSRTVAGQVRGQVDDRLDVPGADQVDDQVHDQADGWSEIPTKLRAKFAAKFLTKGGVFQ